MHTPEFDESEDINEDNKDETNEDNKEDLNSDNSLESVEEEFFD